MGKREGGMKHVESVSLHAVLPSHFKTFHLKYKLRPTRAQIGVFVPKNPFFCCKKNSAECWGTGAGGLSFPGGRSETMRDWKSIRERVATFAWWQPVATFGCCIWFWKYEAHENTKTQEGSSTRDKCNVCQERAHWLLSVQKGVGVRPSRASLTVIFSWGTN